MSINTPSSDSLTLGIMVKSIILILLVAMPLVGAIAPRSMAVAPGLFGLIASMILVFAVKERFALSKGAFIPACVMIGLAAFSSLWSPDAAFALERSGKIALILLPGALLFSLVSSFKVKSIRSVIWLLPIFVALSVCYNISEILFDLPVHRLLRGLDAAQKVPMAVTNRGIICSMVAFFCCIPVLLTHDKYTKFSKLALGALIILTVIMLYLSEGQSGQLGFVIGMLVFFAFPYRHKYMWFGAAAAIIAFIVMMPFVAQIAFQNVVEDVSAIGWLRQGYAAPRLEIWDFVSRYALQNPLYGYGIEGTRLVGAFDSAVLYHPENTILHPHNFAVQIWMEFGVIGVILSSVFVGYILQQIRLLSVPSARVMLSIFAIFLSVASTGYGMWQGWWVGEYMLLLSLGMMVIKTLPQPPR